MIALKKIPKAIILFLLEKLVQWRLRKINPKIVAITGSVGKTSTKEAIYTVVSAKKTTHCAKKNYNSDFGTFLAILEQETGYSNPIKWLGILFNSFLQTWNLNKANPPYQILILEMGADKPGDIQYLIKALRPFIGVFTTIKPVHLAKGQFTNLESIFQEKSHLVKSVPENGWAILNCDDPNIIRLEHELTCNLILFGTSPKADLRAENIRHGKNGLSFTITYEKQSHDLHFPHLLGRHQVYVLLPAIAVGFLIGMPLKAILDALQTFELPPGRLNLIEAINDSIIIDSSYNASPDTMVSALETLNDLQGRKIAVLGSMNELGDYSKQEHLRIGKFVSKIATILITIGQDARYHADGARSAGMPKENIYCFEAAAEAAQFFKPHLRKNDLILVKGSQNKICLENFIKPLMRYPEKASSLLVRQEDHWTKTAF
ncbi:MAG: UDP-N-acetylmuramoylalanyl-D-glutamyl-2,6-diaminopimelate-D-alanyl-D-alanyl ligase, UDP-N-acetylmuramoyl-tripeptide-D-alanyl-D-alanine ligase [Candidatus Peregrinibacteria bacterium GW2011_GWE2_39_6]|nr:MAG: UDP-N-acetylmuramoylalanyl-D-glutamyl-2,6-diaminopimelate-D-alanyl-D-alanyl ligase, UDP-N-acetylmuramoyl-tripeptide-D-alanyl-D-alanine ligase [Candidatus Peregrinibacteria bacterium GW2011_GWE2_39_6]